MQSQSGRRVTDGCVTHMWPSILDLVPYISDGWRALVERQGDLGGPFDPSTRWLFREPRFVGDGRPTPTNVQAVSALFGVDGRERIVLGYHDALLLAGSPYHHAAHALVAAANDWTAEHWLAVEKNLYGMVLVQSALPELAAEEIRRSGQNPKMVAVAMGTNGLGRSFGHPAYHDIYRAAAELDLPIVLQVGSDAATDQITPPVAGGLPTTFGEFRAMAGQPIMSHLVSMIVEGVFDLFPGLRVLILGTGAAWIPPYAWRVDSWYKVLRNEAPWLRRLPSEYLAEHVRVGTWGLEAPLAPGALEKALLTYPELEEMLVYTSGYPNSDAEEPSAIADRVPSAWLDAVMQGNAERLFRWPGRVTSTPGQLLAADYLDPSTYLTNSPEASSLSPERNR